MSALDKSLDDIISSSKTARRPGKKFGRAVAKPSKVGKKAVSANTKAKKAIVANFKKSEPVALSSAIDTSYATKVVASNLPKDLKQENVKDFFQSQVGGVISVALTYNEKGQFRGIATIIFRNHKLASKAVEKYNGAAIDNGSSKLKLELIVDPSKKPLTSRITPNKPVAATPAKKKLAAAKKANAPQKNAKKPQPQQKKKPVKQKKKTVEELDQEMAEYFA